MIQEQSETDTDDILTSIVSCTCTVNHVSGCYHGNTSVEFNITSRLMSQSDIADSVRSQEVTRSIKETSSQISDHIVVAIGVGAAIVIAIVGIFVVVVFRRRKRRAKSIFENQSKTSFVRRPPVYGVTAVNNRPPSTEVVVDNSELYGSHSEAVIEVSTAVNTPTTGSHVTGVAEVFWQGEDTQSEAVSMPISPHFSSPVAYSVASAKKWRKPSYENTMDIGLEPRKRAPIQKPKRKNPPRTSRTSESSDIFYHEGKQPDYNIRREDEPVYQNHSVVCSVSSHTEMQLEQNTLEEQLEDNDNVFSGSVDTVPEADYGDSW